MFPRVEKRQAQSYPASLYTSLRPSGRIDVRTSSRSAFPRSSPALICLTVSTRRNSSELDRQRSRMLCPKKFKFCPSSMEKEKGKRRGDHFFPGEILAPLSLLVGKFYFTFDLTEGKEEGEERKREPPPLFLFYFPSLSFFREMSVGEEEEGGHVTATTRP